MTKMKRGMMKWLFIERVARVGKSVIGKSGKVINSIRQETRANKVVDPYPGAKDRVITIYCYIKEKAEVEFLFHLANLQISLVRLGQQRKH
ncbi:hypothetical protein ACB098_04G045400 [Castanea mollissima]